MSDLKIRRLRLRNWKNFADIEVAIEDRVFLVGPNASGKFLGGDVPGDNEVEEWLLNLRLAATSPEWTAVTMNGMLLFGKNPKRFLPQSGIRAICYSGEKSGLVDQAWDFVRRNTTTAGLEGAGKTDVLEYPESVIREAVGNALVHRDYGIAGAEVMLAIFTNRLEIVSPGNLPHMLTPEKIASGARYARNQTLVNVMPYVPI